MQPASVDAYDAVKETVEEQPFVLGLLAGGLIGFALGALWKMNAYNPPRLHFHPLEAARHYAEPHYPCAAEFALVVACQCGCV